MHCTGRPALWARLTRVRGAVGVRLRVRAMVRGAEAAASARQILSRPIRRISLEHDAFVDVQAQE